MRILSLFSGLGGWEDAWPLSWQVFSVDINPDLNPIRLDNYNLPELSFLTDLADPGAPGTVVAELERRGWDDVDAIIASPPCYEFFKAAFPARQNAKPGDEDTSMSEACLQTTLELILHIRPRYWLVENTGSGLPWVSEYFGRHRQAIGAYFLWHNMPLLSATVSNKLVGARDWNSKNPMRSNYRARIPLSLSKAVRVAMTEQQTLFTIPLYRQWPPL